LNNQTKEDEGLGQAWSLKKIKEDESCWEYENKKIETKRRESMIGRDKGIGITRHIEPYPTFHIFLESRLVRI
jgi:hypothetical protein